MITASLRIRLPDDAWVADISQSFPETTFRLLSGIRTGETAVELGELVGPEPRAAAERVAAHPSIVSYERLEMTDDRSLAKYETTDTALYGFIEASSLPPEFPIVVRNGWYELDYTGTRENFDRLRNALDARDGRYELQSLVETGTATDLLTDRQRTVLETAVRNGYFDVPRGCTLADLGATLEVDKSTVSETLRRAERRVLLQALTGADDRLSESPRVE